MSGTSKKMKKWKVLTAAVVLAVGFWGAPQGAGAATAVSGIGTSIKVGDTYYPITYNSATATATGQYATAVGKEATAEQYGSTAVGARAKAYGVPNSYATAVGLEAKSASVAVGAISESGREGTAVGDFSFAGGFAASAFGYAAKANGGGSLSIGNHAIVGTDVEIDDTGFPTASVGAGSIAIGGRAYILTDHKYEQQAEAANVQADYAIALGSGTSVSGEKSLALGYKSSATVANAVALGDGSVADTANTISVGSSATTGGFTRKIVNVTAGSATTDAANYGQLVKNTTYTASNGSVTIQNNANGTAFTINGLGTSSSSSLVIGDDTKHWLDISWNGAADSTSVTRGKNSTAYGYTANASSDYSTAIGYMAKASEGASTAIGAMAVASGDGAIAIGSANASYHFPSAAATMVNSTAIGSAAYAGGETATALGFISQAYANSSLALGNGANVGTSGTTKSGGVGGIAIGSHASVTADKSVALGYDATASNSQSIAIGVNSFVEAENGTAIGENAVSNESNTVSFGHKKGDFTGWYVKDNVIYSRIQDDSTYTAINYSSDSFARLTNIAYGTDKNDAAAYGQIVTGGSYDSSTGKLTFTNGAGTTAFTIEGITSTDTDTKYTGDNKTVTISTNNVISVNTNGQVSKTDTGIVTGQTVYNAMVTGGSYNSSTGKLTFTNGAGKTAFTIDGFTGGGGTGTTYTAGNGIVIDTTSTTPTISAKVAEKGGLSVDANGLAIKTAEKGGLSVDTNGLAVKVAEKGALSVNENGLAVKVAENGGLTADGSGLSVQKDGKVASGNTGIVTGGTVYNSMVTNGSYDSSTGRLTFTNGKGDTSFSVAINGSGVIYKGDDKTIAISDNNEFSVKYDTTDLTVNDNGIAVKKDGKVESGNTGLVTGGTVYDAMKTMDNQVSQLSDDIQKVGAGAAALAALHPEAYDPNDKWSFAVGYGHYKGANAGALGAFFKPNADTTVSVASTVGNGDSMVNMGVSFKLGNKGKKAGTYRSAVDLVQRIDALEAAMSREIQRNNIQDSRLDAHDSRFDAQEKKIAQLQADIARMQQQLAILLSDTGVAII